MEIKNSKKAIIFTIISNSLIVLSLVGFYVYVIFYSFFGPNPNLITKNEFQEKVECIVVDTTLESKDKVELSLETLETQDSCPYYIKYIVYDEEEDNNLIQEYYNKVYSDEDDENVNKYQNLFSYSMISKTDDEGLFKISIHNKNSILYAETTTREVSTLIKQLQKLDYYFNPSKQYTLLFIVIILIFVISLTIIIVSMWGTLKKTRNEGWISLIPFYNIWSLSKDVLGSPYYSLLMFVPIINCIYLIILLYNIGKVLNNEKNSIGLIFLPTIFWPLMAFDSSTYTKPIKKENKTKVTETKDKELIKIERKKKLWFYTKLYIIPYSLLFILSHIIMIDGSDEDFTWLDFYIMHLFLFIIWVIIAALGSAIIISLIKNKQYNKTKNNKNKKLLITGAILSKDESSKDVYEQLVNIAKKEETITEIKSPLDTMKFTGNDFERYDRAMKLVNESNLIIAEMSNVSTGEGMELQEAARLNIPILVIAKTGSKISGLVKGCRNIKNIIFYDDISSIEEEILKFVKGE